MSIPFNIVANGKYLFGIPETLPVLPEGIELRPRMDCWLIAFRSSDQSEWLVWQHGTRIELRRWKETGDGMNYVDEQDKIVIAE